MLRETLSVGSMEAKGTLFPFDEISFDNAPGVRRDVWSAFCERQDQVAWMVKTGCCVKILDLLLSETLRRLLPLAIAAIE